MAQKFANAARGLLSAGINDSTTSIEITEGGSLFPVANTTDWFHCVLQDETGIEIVRVNTHTAGSNTFTVVRGQGGTTARSFALGSVFGQRVTAADMEDRATLTDTQTLTNKTLTTPTISTPTLTGNVTLDAATANGVLYANGSKVATSGSALTFDGTNLGVGGAATNFGAGFPTLSVVATSGAGVFQSKNTLGDSRFYAAQDGTTLLGSWANTGVAFYQNSLEQMRLTSTGLGIGTTNTSAARLTVVGSAGGLALDDTNGRVLKLDPPGSINGNVAFIGTTTPHSLRINSGTVTNEGTLIFSTENTERARIDSSGNLIQTVNTTAATLTTNQTLTFSIVDNSTLRISVRGSDGTTRTATVALT